MAALSKYDLILAQRTINETMGKSLKPDGAIGPQSRDAIAEYQFTNELPVTKEVDTATWDNMQPYIAERFVTIQNIIDAAKAEKLPPSMILAFWEVESIGVGFLPNRRQVTLFEGHKFYDYVKARLGEKQAQEWARKYPTLCFPRATEATVKYYRTGVAEWARFEQARALDATCAMLSTSWGLFQLMGFNYAYGGFPDVQTMVEIQNQSEQHQLRGILNYINTYRISAARAASLGVKSLRDAIEKRNHRATAAIYNGPAFERFKYDTKLRDADQAWARKV